MRGKRTVLAGLASAGVLLSVAGLYLAQGRAAAGDEDNQARPADRAADAGKQQPTPVADNDGTARQNRPARPGVVRHPLTGGRAVSPPSRVRNNYRPGGPPGNVLVGGPNSPRWRAPQGALSIQPDPAFDRLVPLYYLGNAVRTANSVLLTDAALQVAEGERILRRPRKGLPAEKLMALAAQAAADQHDTASLKRLAEAADARGDQALKGRIAASLKLAGAARALNPAATVSVLDMTPEAFAAYRSLLQNIEQAKLTGNRELLHEAEGAIEEAGPAFSPAQQDNLKKLLTSARAALPEKADPVRQALAQLAAASRDAEEANQDNAPDDGQGEPANQPDQGEDSEEEPTPPYPAPEGKYWEWIDTPRGGYYALLPARGREGAASGGAASPQYIPVPVGGSSEGPAPSITGGSYAPTGGSFSFSPSYVGPQGNSATNNLPGASYGARRRPGRDNVVIRPGGPYAPYRGKLRKEVNRERKELKHERKEIAGLTATTKELQAKLNKGAGHSAGQHNRKPPRVTGNRRPPTAGGSGGRVAGRASGGRPPNLRPQQPARAPAARAHQGGAGRLHGRTRELPAGLEDPAFDRFADLDLLGEAWARMDPGQLTDAALGLTEGERVLHRSHRGLDTKEVLRLAARVAADRGDREALGRLAQAAEDLGDQSLAAKIRNTAKLAGGARAADSALTVSVADTTPEQFATYRAYVEAVQRARLDSDATGLRDLRQEVADQEALPGRMREQLDKLIAQALEGRPARAGGVQNATVRALDQLAGAAAGDQDELAAERMPRLDEEAEGGSTSPRRRPEPAPDRTGPQDVIPPPE